MKKRSLSKKAIRVGTYSVPMGGAPYAVFMFGAVFLLLVSVVTPQALQGVRTKTTDIFSGVLGIVSQPVQDASAFVRNVTGIAELQAENIRLQEENVKLRQWYQTALMLDAENKSLKTLLNVEIEPHHRFITARVLTDADKAFAKSVLIASGKKDSVQKGQAVLSGEGLVGRVVEVGEKSARILMVSDINSRVPILIEGSNLHAVMAGQNDHRPSLIHVPAGHDVQNGARVVTSGHGGVFPKGLPVGRVSKDANGVPEIVLFSDFSRMVYVRIIDASRDPNLRAHEPSATN